MAGNAGAIRAGKAFVELYMDDKRMNRGLKNAQYKLRKFQAGVTAMGRSMIGVGAAILAPMAYGLKAAGDAMETINKFKQILGDQADAAEDWADRTAKAVGRSKYVMMDSLSSFDAFFKGFGFGGAEAREMAERMAGLSLDFASLHNISDEEAQRRFQSGMAGMSRSVREFGINLLDSTVAVEGARMGLVREGEAMTAQQKVIARLSIMTRTLTMQGVTGDAIRTAQSFENRLKALKAAVHDGAVEIGLALIPEAKRLIAWLIDATQETGKWAGANKETIVSVAKLAAELVALGVAALVIGKVTGAIVALITAIKFLRKASIFLVHNPALIALVAAVVGGLALRDALWGAGDAALKLRNGMDALAAAQEEEQAATRAQLAALGRLAEKFELTDAEMTEAAGLIAKLESVYGALGVTLDTVARRLMGVAGAQNKVNAAMRAARERTLKAQLAQEKDRVESLIERRNRELNRMMVRRDIEAWTADMNAAIRAGQEKIAAIRKQLTGAGVEGADSGLAGTGAGVGLAGADVPATARDWVHEWARDLFDLGVDIPDIFAHAEAEVAKLKEAFQTGAVTSDSFDQFADAQERVAALKDVWGDIYDLGETDMPDDQESVFRDQVAGTFSAWGQGQQSATKGIQALVKINMQLKAELKKINENKLLAIPR